MRKHMHMHMHSLAGEVEVVLAKLREHVEPSLDLLHKCLGLPASRCVILCVASARCAGR